MVKKKIASKSEEEMKEEIKEMERKKREAAHKAAAVKPIQGEREVSFDEWYMMRSSSIPSVHRKEVLRADFRGRGLGAKATMSRYDDALAKYGVKL